MSIDMLETIVLHGEKPGPHLLVTGGVHGNEVCGPDGITRFLGTKPQLLAGKITLIPVCNPRAYGMGVRYVDENLGRIIRRYDAPQSYEQELANQLLPFIQAADYVLDLHSVHAKSPAYSFLDRDEPRLRAFTAFLGAQYMVTGWPQLVCGDSDAADISTYAQSLGKVSALLECGQHQDAEATGVAARAIENAARLIGLLEESKGADSVKTQTLHLHTLHYKQREGCLLGDWHDFQPVAAGTPLAAYDDGQVITALKDALIFLPHADANIGDEWFYLGEDVT